MLAALLAGRTVAEWAFFWPLVTSSTSPLDQTAGTSSGAIAILLGVVILGGYVLVASWELVLGRWVALGRLGP